MQNTTSELRKYKGVTLRVTTHWSGSKKAQVLWAGEVWRFDTIKSAKSFIDSITE